jgi:hypothetical protein
MSREFAVQVGTSPTRLTSESWPSIYTRTPWASLSVMNNSSQTVYVGGPGVTVETGQPLQPGGQFYEDRSLEHVWAVVASGTADVRVRET